MSQPEDIPGPVLIEGMRVAANVFNAYHNDDDGLGLEAPGVIVARAIMAERERCAQRADTYFMRWENDGSAYWLERRMHSEEIAGAIRKGGQ